MVTVTITLSDFSRNLNYVYNLYLQTKDAIELRFYKGKGNIFKYEENKLSIYKDIDESIVEIHVNEIMNSIDICDANKVRKQTQIFMGLLYDYGIKPKKLRNILLSMILKIRSLIPDFESAADNITADDILFYIDKIDTFVDLRKYLQIGRAHV